MHPIKTLNGNQLPWLKSQPKKLIKKKNQLYYKARATKSQDDWDKFKHAKLVVQKQRRRSEWDLVNTMLKEGMIKKEIKQFWKYVKSKQQDNIGVSPLKKNVQLYGDSATKVRIVNEQFQSVFSHEDVSRKPTLNGRVPPILQPLDITVIGVEKQLVQLMAHKAAGQDSLPKSLLKELSMELAPSLTAIFSQLISSR